jgi:two-component sensor histidine kinase
MGKAHDLLIHNDWVGADLHQIVTDTVRAYVGDGTQMSVVGEPVQLSSRAALSVAMLLNELCTNAVKYGAWSHDVGVVAISWAKDGTAFRFRWEEQDGPAVTPPSRRGFGTRLITEILPSALGGKGTLGFSTSGCVFELELPVSALNAV